MNKLMSIITKRFLRSTIVFSTFIFLFIAFKYTLILFGFHIGNVYALTVMAGIIAILSLLLNSTEKIKSFFNLFIEARQLVFLAIFLVAMYFFWSVLIAPIEPIRISTNRVPEIEGLKYELFRDLLITLLTLVGIGAATVYYFIKRGLQENMEKEIKRIKILLDCRFEATICVQEEKQREEEGEVERILTQKETPTPLPVWLKSNIDISKATLLKARELDKTKYQNAILYIKNNLAYYLAIAQIEEKRARELAEEVYREAGYVIHGYHWVETYMWVLYRFAKNENETKKARHIFFSELYHQRGFIPDPKFKQKLERYKKFFDMVQT